MSTTLLSLPVELRLQIAEYVFQQTPEVGVPLSLPHNHDYKPSENLALLLVCRKFHIEFTQLAYNKTKFVRCCEPSQSLVCLHILPDHKIQNIRKLGFVSGPMPTVEGQFIFETAQLRLDELEVYCSPQQWAARRESIDDIVSFLRRLPYTKVIKFIMYGMLPSLYHLSRHCAVIGALMKEDHHQRYDAPGAPNIGATWWDWKIHHDDCTSTITFEAQDPFPVLPEEEYLLLMKPRIDAMMAMAEQAAGIGPQR